VSIPFPKFDDAKTVYADLLTRIDTCIAGLDVTQGAMGAGGSDLWREHRGMAEVCGIVEIENGHC
jgi:hypothetical protein